MAERHVSSSRTATVSPYLYWIATAALILPVWSSHYFPTEDGPAHLYYTEVYRDLGTSGSVFQPYYERSVRYDTPNLSYFWLQYSLASVMEPHVAQKVAVSLIVFATAVGIALAATSVTGGMGIGALVALLMVHNYFLYAGFFSFLLGVPLLLGTMALLAAPLQDPSRRGRGLWRVLVPLALLGLLSYYSHLVAGGAFLLLVGIRALYWPGAPLQRRLALIGAALPVSLLILSYMTGPATGSGGLRWLTVRDALSSAVGLWFWQGFAVPGPGFVVRRLVLGGLIGFALWKTARVLLAGGLAPAHRFALLAALCLGLLRFATPDFIGQGGLLVARLDLIAALLLLPVLAPPLSGRSMKVLTALTSVLLGWQLADATGRIHRFSTQYAAVDAAAARIPRGTVIHLGPDYRETETRFEGSYARVFSEIVHEVGSRCDCIVVGEHHSAVPYYWVRERPGAATHVAMLARVDATAADAGAALALRLTPVAATAPRTSEPAR